MKQKRLVSMIGLLVCIIFIGALSSCASVQIPKDPIPKEYIGSYVGDIISANGMAIFTWIAEAKENGEFILNVSKQITKGTIDSDGNFYVKTKGFLGTGLTYKGNIDKNTGNVKGKVVVAFGMSMCNRIEGKRSK